MKRDSLEESHETPSQHWSRVLDEDTKSSEAQGQKLQLSVRLESKTLELIEAISQSNGFSKAETVRRLIAQGVQKRVSKQGLSDSTNR
jgi:hypothetical protein